MAPFWAPNTYFTRSLYIEFRDRIRQHHTPSQSNSPSREREREREYSGEPRRASSFRGPAATPLLAHWRQQRPHFVTWDSAGWHHISCWASFFSSSSSRAIKKRKKKKEIEGLPIPLFAITIANKISWFFPPSESHSEALSGSPRLHFFKSTTGLLSSYATLDERVILCPEQ